LIHFYKRFKVKTNFIPNYKKCYNESKNDEELKYKKIS